MAEIADITPSEAAATDRLLVRRSGSAPYGLDLLSDITPEQLVALAAEIAAARGDRSALADRINTISNFASPNAGGIIVGQYYDNAFQGTSSATVGGAANLALMAPFYTSERFRIDQIGVAVSSASSGVLGRCFVYESDENGWPSDLIFEGASDLDFGTTGYKSHTLDLTFDSGRQYWLGLRTSGGGPFFRGINVSSSVSIGINGSVGSTYFTRLHRTIDFATPLPTSWGFVTGERQSTVPVSIRMRAATL